MTCCCLPLLMFGVTESVLGVTGLTLGVTGVTLGVTIGCCCCLPLLLCLTGSTGNWGLLGSSLMGVGGVFGLETGSNLLGLSGLDGLDGLDGRMFMGLLGGKGFLRLSKGSVRGRETTFSSN